RKVVRTARDGESFAVARQPRKARRSPLDSRGNLQLVHRGLRHRRSEGRKGVARRAVVIDRNALPTLPYRKSRGRFVLRTMRREAGISLPRVQNGAESKERKIVAHGPLRVMAKSTGRKSA